MSNLDTLSKHDDTALVATAIQELPYVTRAYEVLMRRYYRLIYNCCLSMLRTPEDAADASQDIMLKVFNALPQFEARASFKTWLMKITTNTCITRSQKCKLEAERFIADSDGALQDAFFSTVHDPAHALPEAGFSVLVQNLSAEERQILTLRFVGELNIPEIAEAMGLGLSAVKMRYYRSLKKLKAEQLKS